MKVAAVMTELFPFYRNTKFANDMHQLTFVKKNIEYQPIIPMFERVKLKAAKVIYTDKETSVSVFQETFPNSNRTVYIFKPKNKYFDFEAEDADENIVLFSKAIVNYLQDSDYSIVHCFNEETALIPFMIKNNPKTNRIKSVFTFTNFNPQHHEFLPEIKTSDSYLESILAEIGVIELFKLGIVFADKITTTSKNYANEILSEEFGLGLESFFLQRSKDLYGIMNGVNYKIWNPSKDKYIARNYSADELGEKIRNKDVLIKELGLPDKKWPLIIFGGRLEYRKGIDLVINCLPELSKLKINLVIYGTGEEEYQIRLKEMIGRFPNVFIKIDFNEQIAHKLLAGADFILLPTRVEPGGVSHLYALKYGVIPIARRVGGLLDAIVEQVSVNNMVNGNSLSSANNKNFNGFLFTSYYENSLIDIIREAAEVYYDKKIFRKYIYNAMQADWSWKQSFIQYLEVYRKCFE
ncbi:MAG: glycogen/starch synthase [Candidatus Cloacimonetes bacterium]|nr:glycogen/starch synthase [Candidatus Cloacimonadota bacterium]